MTALDNTPLNKNFLSPLNFSLEIRRAPHLNFFCQSANIPSLSFQYPEQSNPFTNIPIPGDRLRFEDLNIVFKVDEDLQNYLELNNWMRSLGFPESFTEYAQIASNSIISGTGTRSDITLMVLNGIKVPNFEITFREAFPISLGSLQFSTIDESINYITCSVSFKYIFFDILKI